MPRILLDSYILSELNLAIKNNWWHWGFARTLFSKSFSSQDARKCCKNYERISSSTGRKILAEGKFVI